MTVCACVIFNVSMVARVAHVACVIGAISAFVPTLCVGIVDEGSHVSACARLRYGVLFIS